jgi:hypothetical protein
LFAGADQDAGLVIANGARLLNREVGTGDLFDVVAEDLRGERELFGCDDDGAWLAILDESERHSRQRYAPAKQGND